MAKINLLPWREVHRQEKKKEFFVILAGVVVLSAFLAFLWVSNVQSAITEQNSRNRLLKSEISALEKQVSEIEQLKERREELLARMRVIQDLEGTRPVIVRFFDDMVRAIPDGVYLNLMRREGESIRLEGIAESNNRVSSFMRNLDESDWFASPNLRSVIAAPEQGEQANSFIMTVRTSAPADETDDEEGED